MLIEGPRLRGKDNREIPLATYSALKNPKGMRGSVLKNMILGISSRNYEEAVEGVMKGYREIPKIALSLQQKALDRKEVAA